MLPGQILRELIENAVVGGVTPESAEAGCALYATFVKGEIVATDATTAEMVKLMENTSRDVNIARERVRAWPKSLGWMFGKPSALPIATRASTS